MAYAPEFKELLAPSEHVFKKFNKLKKGLRQRGEKVKDADMELELIGGAIATDYYKLKVAESSFFVKVTGKQNEMTGGGFREIVSMEKARRVLKEKGIDWAEVVDYKLGYDDGKNKYFVSEWQDFLQVSIARYLGPTIKFYGAGADEMQQKFDVLDVLRAKVRELKKVLSDQFGDIEDYNMSYDPISKKIYIFDLKDKQIKA